MMKKTTKLTLYGIAGVLVFTIGIGVVLTIDSNNQELPDIPIEIENVEVVQTPKPKVAIVPITLESECYIVPTSLNKLKRAVDSSFSIAMKRI